MNLGHETNSMTGNVYHYFRHSLGRWPTNQTLRNLPLDSDRGRKCVEAIDAGYELSEHVRAASGDTDRKHIDAVLAATNYVVTVYSRP
jgi:hypothetical protein